MRALNKSPGEISMSAFKTKAALLSAAAAMALAPAAFAAESTTTVATGDTVTSVTVDAPAAGDTHTLQNDGTIIGINGASWDVVITGSGDGQVVIDNDSTIMGMVDFSGLTGGTTVNNNGTWSMEGWDVYQPVFGSGNDVINNGEDGVIEFIMWSTVMDLGAGDDVIDNAGTISNIEAIARIEFGEGNNRVENSGVISTAWGLYANFGAGDDVVNSSGSIRSDLYFDFGGGTNSFTSSGDIEGALGLTFGDGADRIAISGPYAGAANIKLGAGDDVFELDGAWTLTGSSSVAFGEGDDTFSSTATLTIASPLNMPYSTILSLGGLETFENDAAIVMNAYDPNSIFPPIIGDLLDAPGADFVAGPNSRLLIDADLTAGVADGMSLVGGSTSGETAVSVLIGAEDIGVYDDEGVVVVDVTGGTTHAGDFYLDPSSPGYVADGLFGGGVRVGAYSYSLMYDADSRTHRLVGVPGKSLLRMGMLPAVAQDIWRAGDAAVAARQADLRTAAAGTVGGLWAQVSGDRIERDQATAVTVLGQTDTADVSYQQQTAALTLGGDILGEGAGGRYSLGFMVGPTSTAVEFEGSASEVELEGVTAAVYGGFTSGDFFVDLSLTGSGAKVNDDKSFSEAVKTEVTSIGVRAEAGYRLGLGEGLHVEPLVAIVHVATSFEDLRLPGAPRDAILYDDAASTRLGVGARLGLETGFAGLDMRASLTGRYWKEMEAENGLVVRNAGADPRFVDDFGGDFAEVNAVIDLSSPEGAVSGFANLGGRFGEDYRAANAAVGLRYNW